MTPINVMERSRFRSGACLFFSLIPLLLLLGATSTGSQSISMVGYDLSKATQDGSNPGNVKGKVLLLDNAAQSLGIIFAFSVLVGNPNPFTLQLYHVDVSGKTYHLGQEFTITPSVKKGREDIYIESLLNRRCVVVRPGDRLALNVTSETPAVQANFNDSSQMGLCSGVQTDGTLTCETTYPWSIRAAAYYIVSNDSLLRSTSSDAVDCPLGTLIPGSRDVTTVTTTTVPRITGMQGVMGSTGIQGAAGFKGIPGVLGSTGSRGSTGATGPLGFLGAYGVSGATGMTGNPGATGGMGATGSKGPSDIGDLGVPGIRGPPGPMGQNFTVFLNRPPPRNQAAQLSDDSSSDSTDPFWSSSRAIWATYLWMALVSFLLLIVVVVFVVIVFMHRSFSGPGSAPATVAESKTNIMDDDAPSNYSDLGTVEH